MRALICVPKRDVYSPCVCVYVQISISYMCNAVCRLSVCMYVYVCVCEHKFVPIIYYVAESLYIHVFNIDVTNFIIRFIILYALADTYMIIFYFIRYSNRTNIYFLQ